MITGIVRGPAGGVRGGALFRRAPVPDGFEAPLAPPPLRGERGMVRLTGGTREAPAAIVTTRPAAAASGRPKGQRAGAMHRDRQDTARDAGGGPYQFISSEGLPPASRRPAGRRSPPPSGGSHPLPPAALRRGNAAVRPVPCEAVPENRAPCRRSAGSGLHRHAWGGRVARLQISKRRPAQDSRGRGFRSGRITSGAWSRYSSGSPLRLIQTVRKPKRLAPATSQRFDDWNETASG